MSVDRMRLLFVIDSFGSGGAQAQMTRLALALSRRGHAVEFFIYHPQHRHWAPAIANAGIRVHEYRKSGRVGPGVWLALRRLIAGEAYDAVLAFLDTPGFYAELARFPKSRPALVVSERSSSSTEHARVRRAVLRQFHRLADFIVVNSHHQRGFMMDRHRWMRPKIGTILNGIDTTEFAPRDPRPIANGRLRLLSIGTIVPYKNVLGLVRAIAHFRRKYGGDLAVDWAGKRMRGRAGERTFRSVELLLTELGVADCWRWLGERRDIADLLPTYDGLLHPSFFEGTSNAVCEALASGCPVIAGDIADHRQLVSEPGAGLLFDPHDPCAIADAIHSFAEASADARAEMSRRARRVAETMLSLDRYTEEYEKLLESLIARRRARSAHIQHPVAVDAVPH